MAPSVDKLTVECIRDTEGIDALEQEWNALLDRCPATVFQSYEWLRAWWNRFGGHRELVCFTFRDLGRLVGIAPLFLETVSVAGMHVARRMQFLGAGLSDYLDFLMMPGYETSVLRHFVDTLLSSRSEWDVLDLEDVPEASRLVSQLSPLMEQAGLRMYPYQFNVCPRLQLEATWDLTLQRLGPSARQGFRRKARRIQDLGTSVEAFKRPSDDIEQGVSLLADIHGKRWKSLGHPSAFDDPEVRGFYHDVARSFARRGWLRLYLLKVGDEYAATCLNFNFRSVIYMYQCNAHASPDVMRLSPGSVLRGITMQEGIEEGMTVFDFLRGDESYKWREWKAVPARNWMIRIASNGPMSTVRFRTFLILELTGKGWRRLRLEYYNLRRFTKGRSFSWWSVFPYLGTRLSAITRLGVDFVVRHLKSKRLPTDSR